MGLLMFQQEGAQRSRKSLSLTVRVSILLTLVGILPLIITIVISETLSRPALVAQASAAMSTDSQIQSAIDRCLCGRASP